MRGKATGRERAGDGAHVNWHRTDSRPFGAKGEQSASRQESKAKSGRNAVPFKFSFSVYLFIYFTFLEL